MKELSIEEKAKAYDGAVERLRNAFYDNNSRMCEEYRNAALKIIEPIFPELVETEDEKVRKEIINYFEHHPNIIVKRERKRDWIAWLEKQSKQKPAPKYKIGDTIYFNSFGKVQSMIVANIVDNGDNNPMYEDIDGSSIFENDIIEQKSTDKVEPKFHEGEWVIDKQGIVHQIANVIENVTYHTYGYDIVGGGYFNDNTEGVRLWTIEDAKDGDVLATLDYILIFKKLLKNDGGISYCHYDFGAGNPQFIWLEDKNWYFGKEAIIHPATKEQRDLLFQKMKEAGYEWSDKDRKLIKIVE